MGAPGGAVAAEVSIVVENTSLGQTTKYIGATEAGVFFVDDLDDLGVNVYRMWTKMNELEWWDDDDAEAGYNCTLIGTPDIAAIKSDQAAGFVTENAIHAGYSLH